MSAAPSSSSLTKPGSLNTTVVSVITEPRAWLAGLLWSKGLADRVILG
jgi:hypothetical protein